MEDEIDTAHLAMRRWVAALRSVRAREALDQLAAILPPHFGDEERAGGLFDRATRCGLARDAMRLKAQHADLIAQIDRLRGPPVPGWEDDVAALAAALERHEWEENCMLAACTDDDAYDPRSW